MKDRSLDFAVGSPRFADPQLAALAASEGALAAWREAFACHGAAAAAGVTGAFAVGLTEPSGRAFLAVDRFAIDSLCWRVDGAGGLRFAARADALADASTGLDPQAIFDYLFFHAIPSPRTVYQGIFRLPPAHAAVFDNGRLSVAPYWAATFREAQNPSFDALRTQFRDHLRDAVAAQLDGGKPGCFLSGGTDSSTVAGMIGVAAGRPAATYSIGFDAAGYDEMEYARIAARHFGTEHHEYYVTPADLVRSIPAVAAHCDQPFGNSSSLPAYYCAKMAKDDGVGRILAGDGGDELFGGNSRYAKQRLFGFYDNVPGGLRSALVEPLLNAPGAARIGLLRKASSYVEQARVPMPDRLQMYNLLLRLGIDRVLTPAFIASVDTADPARQQQQVWNAARGASAINRTLAFDWRYTLAENDLPKVCGTTRMAGIGVGFPMLDARLHDFSLTLPSAYKLKGLKLRWFFKEALRGFLPDAILAKKKQGFGLPFGVWVQRDAALRGLAVDSLRSLATRGIVRPDFIDALLGVHFEQHPAYYGEMIWILMMLEQWLRAKAPDHGR